MASAILLQEVVRNTGTRDHDGEDQESCFFKFYLIILMFLSA